MATKSKKTRKTSKRRLALPPNLARNLDDVRKNIQQVQKNGAKEVEKIYNKVIEIDFVQKVRKHDVVKKATKAKKQWQKEAENQFKNISKKIEQELKSLRDYIPVPTKSEVDSLARKVNALNRKVNELSTSGKKSAVG